MNLSFARSALFLLILLTISRAGERNPVPFDSYVITNFTADNGLPQNTVDVVHQSSDGYIWIGTYAGLARFDGVKFVHYNRTITPAFRINHVTAMQEWPTGVYWFGTNGGGIIRSSRHQFSGVDAFNTDGREFIKSIIHLGSDVLVGTERGGIHRIILDAAGTVRDVAPFLAQQLPKNILFRAMTPFGTDGIAVATDIGLIIADAKGVRTLTTKEGLPDNSITALAVDKTGALWIGTSNGLARYLFGSVQSFTTAHGLTNNTIRTLFVDADNIVWIGTDGGGVNRFTGGTGRKQFDAFTAEHGLVNDFIRTIFQDSERNMWIGTRNGLSQLHVRKFSLYNKRNGLSDSYVRTVLEDSQHRIWVGTNGSGLNCIDNGKITRIGEREIPNSFIRALFQDRQGILWIGTDGGGVVRYDERAPRGKQYTTFTTKNGLTENYIRAFAEGFDNDLLVATYGGGISCIKGTMVKPITTRQGLANDNVLAMVRSPLNEVWVGTNGGGINRITPRGIQNYTTKDGLSNNYILSLFADQKGTLWIGTNGGGINRFMDGKFDTYTTRDGLREDVSLMIMEDNDGFLWIGGNQGITRIPKSEFSEVAAGQRKKFSRIDFGRSDGLQNAEVSGVSSPCIIKSSTGSIWFTTVGGLAVVDTARIPHRSEEFPLRIEEVRLGDRTLYPDTLLEIEPGNPAVEFHYTGLSYMAPERLHFRYKLEGFDANWNDAGTRRVAYYTNIPPGTYTFRVSTSIDGGFWSTTEATIPVVFRPLFYQTPFFGIIAGIGLILLGAGLYAIRTANIRRHAEHLRKEVNTRTHELREAKEKIELHLKDVESARDELSAINIQLNKANREKSDLLSIISHDFRNKVVNLHQFAQSINTSDSSEPAVREHSELMEQTTKYMLKLIEDTLSSSALEQGKLMYTPANVDIVQVTELVVSKYRLQQRAKTQTITFTTTTDACPVNGSDRWLTEAIDNLVNNAGKFSPAGSEIAVTVESENGVVRVHVKDQGPGLTEEDRQQVFQKFKRLSAQPTGGEISTGLGLAIVKKIVEMHHGRVSVASTPGHGATFTVELPMEGRS